MIESKEDLERLKSQRANLEEESRSLEEKQNQLDLRTHVLEEKIAIRDLESMNSQRRTGIAQLESRIQELENKLESIPNTLTPPASVNTQEPNAVIEESLSEQNSDVVNTAEDHTEEQTTQEDFVQVSALDNEYGEEQTVSTFGKTHEKKKRRFL